MESSYGTSANAFLLREATKHYNNRDFDRLREMGLSPKTAKVIADLPIRIAERFACFRAEACSLKVVSDNYILMLIQHVQHEDRRDILTDQLIQMGASQAMLAELLGLDANDYRNRRRALGLPKACAGRPAALTEEESVRTHSALHRHRDEKDMLIKFYKVGMETGIPLARIWQHMQTQD